MAEEQSCVNDTREQIRNFISNNFVLPYGLDQLDDESSFLDEGIIDSTGVVELVVFLEENFSIEVEDEELIPDNLDSVNKVIAYVKGKTGDAA